MSIQFVYCIAHFERGAVKIGISRDPHKRLKQLQTGSADQFLLFDSFEGDRALEIAFHRNFAARRLNGEWFDDRDHAVRDLFGRMAWNRRAAA